LPGKGRTILRRMGSEKKWKWNREVRREGIPSPPEAELGERQRESAQWGVSTGRPVLISEGDLIGGERKTESGKNHQKIEELKSVELVVIVLSKAEGQRKWGGNLAWGTTDFLGKKRGLKEKGMTLRGRVKRSNWDHLELVASK